MTTCEWTLSISSEILKSDVLGGVWRICSPSWPCETHPPQTSHSSASSAFSLQVYLAGIDGDFHRPWVCTACSGAPRRVILIARPTRPE